MRNRLFGASYDSYTRSLDCTSLIASKVFGGVIFYKYLKIVLLEEDNAKQSASEITANRFSKTFCVSIDILLVLRPLNL